MIPSEYVRSILDYNPVNGIFTWRKRSDVSNHWNGRYAGTIAGRELDNGRITLSIHKQGFFAHRVAYLWMMCRWPGGEIDHINGNPSDNRWENLRVATPSQNKMNRPRQSNNKSGFKGVSWKRDKKKWRAVINDKHLGYFNTAEAAHRAYCAASAKYHGEFSHT